METNHKLNKLVDGRNSRISKDGFKEDFLRIGRCNACGRSTYVAKNVPIVRYRPRFHPSWTKQQDRKIKVTRRGRKQTCHTPRVICPKRPGNLLTGPSPSPTNFSYQSTPPHFQGCERRPLLNSKGARPLQKVTPDGGVFVREHLLLSTIYTYLFFSY